MTAELFRTWRPRDRETRSDWILLGLVTAAGGALRFWGLGSIGLHGDEDVMALATLGILETGAPIIPSGMFYPRALPQLYLMALSVNVFGDSEWALRLPSAVMGTLMIVLGYGLGRRFLTVHWAILFAAAIALLPSMITLSQTARMYVFYVAFVMLFAIVLFRWERTESIRDLLLAAGVCMAAMLFQTLAVFATLLFFYPGLLKRSGRLLGLGAAAFVVCGIAFKLISDWGSAQYYPLLPGPGAERGGPEGLQNPVAPLEALLALVAVALAAGAGWLAARAGNGTRQRPWFVAGVALLAAAGVLALLIQYHLAALAWFLGTICYLRSGGKALLPAGLGLVLLLLFGFHAWAAWHSPEVTTFYDLAEALLGKPKPLPYLTFFFFSPPAVAVYGLVALYFAVQFARGRPLPDHVLFFLISVFAPLFLIGFFAEVYAPPRYMIGTLPFFVLCVFAGVRELVVALSERLQARAALAATVAALVTLALFVDPAGLRYNVNPQYADFARLTDRRGVDHKGAAEYVMSRGSDEEVLVIVMDSQQHGYYLREYMDYYMRSLHDGRNSSIMRDGRMLNLYTGAPQIATGEQLALVVRESQYDEILVVGSGELEQNRMRYMAEGIWSTMQKLGFEQAWLGRDRATPVWRYESAQAERAGPPSGAGPGTADDGD